MLNASQRNFVKKIVDTYDIENVAKECKLNVRKVTEQMADPESELYGAIQEQIARRKVMNDFFTQEVLVNELVKMFMSPETVAKDKIQAANIIIKLMNPEGDASERIAKVLEALTD